jgi:hypothetical protein
MKNPVKNVASLATLLLLVVGLFTLANASTINPDNLLVPVEKKGKYAKLDVSSLPMDKNVTIKVRDENDILVYELKVKNTGQHQHVLVDFNRLKTGVYSLNILRGENDVVRKNLDIRWNQVIVKDVVTLSRDIGHEYRWPLNSVW